MTPDPRHVFHDADFDVASALATLFEDKLPERRPHNTQRSCS
jgi:hypothetical protein